MRRCSKSVEKKSQGESRRGPPEFNYTGEDSTGS